jgi:hypothetical protein
MNVFYRGERESRRESERALNVFYTHTHTHTHRALIHSFHSLLHNALSRLPPLPLIAPSLVPRANHH